MGEKVSIPVELDVDVVRAWQQEAISTAEDFEDRAKMTGYTSGTRIDILARAAVLRYELPYEPSEQDVTDYCEARGWHNDLSSDRRTARHDLVTARARGWDAVPRRIGDDR